MNPLLTFSAGLLAGVAAIRWLKSDKARAGADTAQSSLRETADAARQKTMAGLDLAQEKLRGAAIAGLSAVEHSSAQLRTRLTSATGEQPAGESGAAAASAAADKPRRSPRKKAAPKELSKAAPEKAPEKAPKVATKVATKATKTPKSES